MDISPDDELPSYDPIQSDHLIHNVNISTTHSLCEETNVRDVGETIVEDSIEIITDAAALVDIDMPIPVISTTMNRRKTKGEIKQAQRERSPGKHEGPEYQALVNAKCNEKKLKKGPKGTTISTQKRSMLLLALILTSLTTEAFVTKLEKLQVEIAAKELDYTDDSYIVRDMKAADPPKLRVVTDDMYLQDETALTSVGHDLYKLYELKAARL